MKWNFEKFQREYPECTRDFEGVKMEHIPMIEQCFNKRIEIFTKRTVNETGKLFTLLTRLIVQEKNVKTN